MHYCNAIADKLSIMKVANNNRNKRANTAKEIRTSPSTLNSSLVKAMEIEKSANVFEVSNNKHIWSRKYECLEDCCYNYSKRTVDQCSKESKCTYTRLGIKDIMPCKANNINLRLGVVAAARVHMMKLRM